MKKSMLLVAMLTMVLAATVPGLAQDGEFDVTSVPEVQYDDVCSTSAPSGVTPEGHVPGEFIVSYESVEAMWAAPQENVKSTGNDWGWYYTDTGPVYYPIPNGTQVLSFEDIVSIPDPCERLAAEEAKRQEILTWPGVKYANYNSLGTVD